MATNCGQTLERSIRQRLDIIKQIFGGNLKKALARCADMSPALALVGFDVTNKGTWTPSHLVAFTFFFANENINIPYRSRNHENPLGTNFKAQSTHGYKRSS